MTENVVIYCVNPSHLSGSFTLTFNFRNDSNSEDVKLVVRCKSIRIFIRISDKIDRLLGKKNNSIQIFPINYFEH